MVKVTLPNASAQFDTPTMVYTLMTPVGSKIFNFNKFVNNRDVMVFYDDNFILLYEYTASPFVDKDRNHVIRGNFKTNNRSHKLSSKDPSTVKIKLLFIKKLRKA